MKKLQYIFSAILSLLISANVLAEAANTHQSTKLLSDKYLNQAQEAYDKKEYAGAVELLQKSAQLDNAKANQILGMMYYVSGPGITFPKPDDDLAMKYMSRAAQLGDDDAKKMLIQFQLKGFGNTPDEKVLKLRSEYEAQVSNSNVNKVNHLLDLVDSYLNAKKRTFRNVGRAEYFASQLLGLQLDDHQKYTLSLACLIMSMEYMWGHDGSQKNPQKSFQWMQTAAKLQLKEAYYHLSDMYFYGYGTSINFKKSIEMTKLGNKLEWPPSDSLHKKHLYPFLLRPFIYFGLFSNN